MMNYNDYQSNVFSFGKKPVQQTNIGNKQTNNNGIASWFENYEENRRKELERSNYALDPIGSGFTNQEWGGIAYQTPIDMNYSFERPQYNMQNIDYNPYFDEPSQNFGGIAYGY